MKDYGAKQLTENNGQSGTRALVAVNGSVYDVSESKRWADGFHMKRHRAGQDLSEEIKAAPHGLDVLDRVELVGNYVKPEERAAAGLRGRIEAWLDKHPFFRRHPHPAVVHLPIGLITVTPVFEALALVTASPRTEWAAYCCLIVGVLFIPAAMTTGYFTWWINYDAVDSPILRKKRTFAWVALCVGTLAFLTRTFAVLDPLNLADLWVILYMAILVKLAVVVSTVGFLGGKLTFPYD